MPEAAMSKKRQGLNGPALINLPIPMTTITATPMKCPGELPASFSIASLTYGLAAATLLLTCAACIAKPAVNTRQCDPAVDNTSPKDTGRLQLSSLCTASGQARTLSYNSDNGRIVLTVGGRRTTVEVIKRNYFPDLVAAEENIRFLPQHLQLYEHRNKLLYLTAIRSSGGSGGGQCGSGAEIYLNIWDIPHKVRTGRFLVQSCWQSIELQPGDDRSDLTKAFEARDGRLHMTFLFYKDVEGEPSGYLSDDLSTLYVGGKPQKQGLND